MGAVYFYLPESALLVSAYWGRTRIEESDAMRQARADDPARREARAHVIDLVHHEGTTAPPQTESAKFLGLGESYFAAYGNLPTVIIAARPHIFGQARIFASVAGVTGPEARVEVVRTWREAADALGMDLTAAEEETRRRREASESGASSG